MAKTPGGQTRSRTKVFRVFEAGPGEIPTGLFKQAYKTRSQRRAFTAVEEHGSFGLSQPWGGMWSDFLKATLHQAGLKEMPKNIKWIQGKDAVEEIAKVPKNSQGVVFASFVLNNIKGEPRLLFLKRAKEALRPGGRIVFVQDRMDIKVYGKIAKDLGMDFYVKEITDAQAEKSYSESIRERATPERRINLLRRRLKALDVPNVTEQKLKELQEFSRPTIFSFKKRRE